ncbi:Pol [Symbiodinium natans]|uniref:Pol protein n=1 Tax=Symbiodinium natans TaxID=878477 RepID=A0A812UBP3_9DINO|nr:Pol [Symbiodinium natans]
MLWLELLGLYSCLRLSRCALELLTCLLAWLSQRGRRRKAAKAKLSKSAPAGVSSAVGAAPPANSEPSHSPQLSLHVCLLSGRGLDLRMAASAGLAELRWRVEEELGTRSVDLISPKGDILRGDGTLQAFGLQDGDLLQLALHWRKGLRLGGLRIAYYK